MDTRVAEVEPVPRERSAEHAKQSSRARAKVNARRPGQCGFVML